MMNGWARSADSTPCQSADYTRGEEKAAKQFVAWANRILDDGDTGGVCVDPEFEALKQRLLALRPRHAALIEAKLALADAVIDRLTVEMDVVVGKEVNRVIVAVAEWPKGGGQ